MFYITKKKNGSRAADQMFFASTGEMITVQDQSS
jgi:hypothetical protein